MEAQLLTPEQVADRLQLKLNTVYVWLREGRLPGIRLGHRWRVAPEALAEFIGAGAHGSGAATGEAAQRPRGAAVPIWQRFLDAAESMPETIAAGLPSDGAENHDHYLYGWAKRSDAA